MATDDNLFSHRYGVAIDRFCTECKPLSDAIASYENTGTDLKNQCWATLHDFFTAAEREFLVIDDINPSLCPENQIIDQLTPHTTNVLNYAYSHLTERTGRAHTSRINDVHRLFGSKAATLLTFGKSILPSESSTRALARLIDKLTQPSLRPQPPHTVKDTLIHLLNQARVAPSRGKRDLFYMDKDITLATDRLDAYILQTQTPASNPITAALRQQAPQSPSTVAHTSRPATPTPFPQTTLPHTTDRSDPHVPPTPNSLHHTFRVPAISAKRRTHSQLTPNRSHSSQTPTSHATPTPPSDETRYQPRQSVGNLYTPVPAIHMSLTARPKHQSDDLHSAPPLNQFQAKDTISNHHPAASHSRENHPTSHFEIVVYVDDNQPISKRRRTASTHPHHHSPPQSIPISTAARQTDYATAQQLHQTQRALQRTTDDLLDTQDQLKQTYGRLVISQETVTALRQMLLLRNHAESILHKTLQEKTDYIKMLESSASNHHQPTDAIKRAPVPPLQATDGNESDSSDWKYE